MAKTNEKVNVRSNKEVMGMLVNVGEKQKSLVKFITDDVFVDTDVNVSADYEFPKTSVVNDDGETVFCPVYYVCKLNVQFAKDVKNDTTTKDKDVRKANNDKIMENAHGFKAVCRDMTLLAGKTEKCFLKMTASMPCDKKVNVNGSISNLWLFTSKVLRQNWLDMVQRNINNGEYHLQEKTVKQPKKLKKVLDIATCMDISYEEAYKIAVAKKIIKEK